MDPPRIYRLGPFVLDLGRGALLGRGGTEISLRRKSFSLLRLLVENAGQLLTRESLMAELWPNIYVTDESLTQCVREVRHALGAESRHLLRTIAGRGYIFEPGTVRQEPQAAAQVIDFQAFRANDNDRVRSSAPPGGDETSYTADGVHRHRPGLEGPVRLSVMVVPLHSLHGSGAQERLARSVTGDIVTDLNRYLERLAFGEAQVLLHNDAAAQPRTTSPDDQAQYMLRGGVQGTRRPSVNLQLLNAESGVCLWAERCELGRRHAVIARLMCDVATVLVRDVARRIEALSRTILTSSELILLGRASLLRGASPGNRYQALRCFEQALAMRPDLTGAKLGVAGSLIYHLSNGWSHTIERDEGRAEGLLLDVFHAGTDMASAHTLRGTLRRLQGRLDESLVELELATERAPYVGMAASQLGMTLLYCGRPEAALPHFEAGVRSGAHDPMRPMLLSNLGTCRLLLGDVDRAIEVLRWAAAAYPQHSVPSLMLAAALGLRSATDEASAPLRRAVELCPSWGTLSGLRNWVRRQARPELMPIYEATLERGLQRAGMSEA